MRAGTMTDRVTLQRWTPENDPVWGPAPGWTDVAELWASVIAVSGTERPEAHGVQSTITHRVRMRYRADITEKDRLIYRGRILDLVSVIDVDGGRAELAIEAREHPLEA